MATALVTGASRGLGRGVALELARAGWSVAINYNSNREAAEATAAACVAAAREAGWGGAHAPSGARAAGTTSRGGVPGGGDARGVETSAPRFVPVQGNVGDAADRARMVDEAWAIAGPLDALVNNAGIAPRVRADITEAGEESFEELIHTNLQGPYFLTQAVVNRWMAEGGSVAEGVLPRSIVFVTSISATTASVNRGDYCISKAGLAMAAQLWAVRLAAEGINVYEVRPGVMETDMTSGVKERYDALIADGLVPQRRWGVPADIGRAVRSLVAGDFAFSTGAVIYSDGGFHLSRL